MDDQNNIIKTFTELAPRYEEVVDSELSRFWGWSYKRFVENFLENIPIEDGDIVLDVATGTGEIPLTWKLNGASENNVHGLDITFTMLEKAKRRLTENNQQDRVDFVCASGMEMPYAGESFQVVTCALATHHMDVDNLTYEIHRILQDGGRVAIADVGASAVWKLPGIKLILRLAAFVYFLFKETLNRAWAEAGAISKIRSIEEWNEILHSIGFSEVKFTKLKSRYFWIPEPHIINAIKLHGEEK
jgi:ubiquinone/menaquinone biosynthesis C-methylase UbiE